MSQFEKELERLINKHSMERGSNTPDFLLAEYLTRCLATFNTVVTSRELWYGIDRKSVDSVVDLTDE